jgi:hypothetical protein
MPRPETMVRRIETGFDANQTADVLVLVSWEGRGEG